LPKIKDSIKEELDNRVYGALAVAAFISMITGFFSEEGYLGWMQGFSIYIGLFILIAFGSVNDWMKDKQFIQLQSWFKKDHIAVVRGGNGNTSSVSIYKLVVGDVIILEQGCIVPADCILV
jgi:Ca2+-transporting ATPase